MMNNEIFAKKVASQLGALTASPNQQLSQLNASRQEDVYDQLRAAQQEWQLSCHAFAAAQARRDQAQKMLQDVMGKCAVHVEQMMRDPTQAEETARF